MFRLEPERASLNGGFGKAYALATRRLHDRRAGCRADRRRPNSRRIDHMNKDHATRIDLYARHFANAATTAGR